jgi:hypothetical protein
MIPRYRRAIVKWNGGRGALLCNRCGVILAVGFVHDDTEHYCQPACEKVERPEFHVEIDD